jgi:hypothetical protein
MSLQTIQTQINTLTHFLSLVLNHIYRLETELRLIRNGSDVIDEESEYSEEDSE